jgi:uroporphyrinogen-III synthase
MQHPQREQLTRLPLFVVGDATREAAREAGFTDIVSANGDAHALAALIKARVPHGDLLYLAGEVVTGNLAEELEAAGFMVHTVTVYRAIPQTALPPSVADALRERKIDAVLHYSRRSAETFLGLAGAAGVDINSLDCNQFCLSRQIGEPLLQAGLRAVHVAARPDEAAMLDLIDTQASQPAGRANG